MGTDDRDTRYGHKSGSGSTGKAGLSMYYVAQFLREQSHTVVD